MAHANKGVNNGNAPTTSSSCVPAHTRGQRGNVLPGSMTVLFPAAELAANWVLSVMQALPYLDWWVPFHMTTGLNIYVPGPPAVFVQYMLSQCEERMSSLQQ